MLSQQQDLPDIILFRDCLSLGRLAEWQLAAFRGHQFAISDGLGHRQMWRTHPDQPNVFAAIAFPSTGSVNFSWDGHGIKEDGKFQKR
jgi:hypothetical protein